MPGFYNTLSIDSTLLDTDGAADSDGTIVFVDGKPGFYNTLGVDDTVDFWVP